jgi:hypothetical protein
MLVHLDWADIVLIALLVVVLFGAPLLLLLFP